MPYRIEVQSGGIWVPATLELDGEGGFIWRSIERVQDQLTLYVALHSPAWFEAAGYVPDLQLFIMQKTLEGPWIAREVERERRTHKTGGPPTPY